MLTQSAREASSRGRVIYNTRMSITPFSQKTYIFLFSLSH